MKRQKTKKLSQAMAFILLFGIVSLFSDMTHEGASSIRGAYLSLLGASAGTIGFVSGLGELVGYSMRYVFGRLTDKTKRYWPMTILGYVLDILAVPALALVGEHGWVAACALLVIQRMGKAIKKPAKDTIMSFAASREGAGKSFAIQEVLDQFGAFLGPVLLYLVMLLKTDGTAYQVYSLCFAVLAVPGAITVILLLVTKRRFPDPERFEPSPKEYVPFKMKREFILYIAGISLFAFGFIDYSLVIMHVSRSFTNLASGLAETSSLVNGGTLPLLYAGAMLVDAVAALVFGLLYDKKGVRALVWSTLISAPFAIFVFAGRSVGAVLLGVALWGVGMGAQESILKAAVTGMVPKSSRATGYGIFECAFGVFWFLGSWLLGVLYDVSVPAMIGLSVAAQLAAIPLYLAPPNWRSDEGKLRLFSPAHADKMNPSNQKGAIAMMKDFGVKPYLYPMPTYMISTYNDDGTVDSMMMAWGGICAEDMVALNLEASHKTVANLRARGAFTLSVPGADTLAASDYMGIASANDTPDKFERTGLHAVKSTRVDAPVIVEYPLTLECTVERFEDEPYGLRVLGRIVNVMADEKVLDELGRIDAGKLNAFAFDQMRNGYYAVTEKVGQAWNAGAGLLKK